ncbi:hypothetical protein N657DRAFT_634932 [Parathielavia appendiculata]|uniref:Aminoglycoside phosphotransferase domain-containing protein n=1 Tax=Parathielavia appendiculata TaxID=2587402 RepID=A0AAN6TWL0_9PEZI|nr:hypothetical protein N657DRAFT_634932 [Parathielavia appendiculata]
MPISSTRCGLLTTPPLGIDLSDRNRKEIYLHTDRVIEKVGNRYILKTTGNTLSPNRRHHNILEGRVPGYTLADCWQELSLGAKLDIAQEIVNYMLQLSRFTNWRMETVSGKRLPNNCFNPRPRDSRGYLSGRWSTDDDIFNNEFYPSLRRAGLSRETIRRIRRTMAPCWGQMVLTHCDLFVGNVMVDPKRGVITGIIDWKSGGYWPEWFQYARITHGCSKDDGEWKWMLSRASRDYIRHAEHGRVWWGMVQTFLYEPDSAEAMVWLGLLLGYLNGRVSRATLERYQGIGEHLREQTQQRNRDMARMLSNRGGRGVEGYYSTVLGYGTFEQRRDTHQQRHKLDLSKQLRQFQSHEAGS